MKPVQRNRGDYSYFRDYQTRWRDNDIYGHMNNVVFYEFVDTTINFWLNYSGALPVPKGKVIGLVVHTECDYYSTLGFPNLVTCGLKLAKKGKTSVTYDVGLFNQGEKLCAAQALFVHVYVDSKTYRPIPLPLSLINALMSITNS